MAGPLELKAAVMDARMAESDRIDLSAGVAKAQQGRLNQLSELLTAVRSDIPEGDDRFSLAVLPGATPRLWVDPTSFVMLSDDNRTYRFVKDTRGGRRALAESTNTADIAESEDVLDTIFGRRGDFPIGRHDFDGCARSTGNRNKPSAGELRESLAIGYKFFVGAKISADSIRLPLDVYEFKIIQRVCEVVQFLRIQRLLGIKLYILLDGHSRRVVKLLQ